MADAVLIVDDNVDDAKKMYRVMKSSALDADRVNGGEEALSKIRKKQYAAILLAINLKGMSGFEVLEKIRRSGNSVPVIIVSSRNEELDVLYALNIGADQYITKPFNPVIMGAIVKALIRRSKGIFGEKNILNAGPFQYDTSTLRLYKNHVEIPLSGKENAIVKLFLDNVNHVFSKERLYELVWDNLDGDDNTVMVYINHLRHKIEDDPSKPKYIQTVRGIGYRFVV